MKIKLDKTYAREVLTAYEVDIAKAIIADFKDDATTAEELLTMAANSYLGYNGVEEVLKASATIVRDITDGYDAMGNTAFVNVWLEGTIETRDSFIKIGVLLSRIFKICGDEYRITKDNASIREYKLA